MTAAHFTYPQPPLAVTDALGQDRWCNPLYSDQWLSVPAYAVTLFEGGRVYGADVINELIDELHASVAMSEGFEGEMKNLVNYARRARERSLDVFLEVNAGLVACM